MIEILIRYLGIKTKMLEHIKEEIDVISNKGDTILDLFAGSNIVSQYLMDDYKVYTNDIQYYSYIVSNATVCNKYHKFLTIDDILKDAVFATKYNALYNLFEKTIKYEELVFGKIKDGVCSIEELREFKNYFDNYPTFAKPHFAKEEFSGLDKYFTEEYYSNSKLNGEFNLFTCVYSIPYFSTKQAIFIDSYICWLNSIKDKIDFNEYCVYLSCLIYALGITVTSIGDHFAQPQKFKIGEGKDKYTKELMKIAYKKDLNYQSLIAEKLEEFKYIKNGENNKAFNMEALTLLKSSAINDVDIIYMDPPYTNAHYSRFYHILETLCKYDYPVINFNAKYRENRYQSSFCIKSKAKKEFELMVQLCWEKKKKIVISYSDTEQCLITKKEILSVCEKFYNKVTLKDYDYLYRNFGQKPRKVSGNELLIICNI